MNASREFEDTAYLRDAAGLRLRLEAWREDRAYCDDGGEILYAVDTDIVVFLISPQDNSRYAIVFQDDDSVTQEALAWALGRFIFYRLTGEHPLLVVPPHHLEIDRVFSNIASKAPNEAKTTAASLGRLEALFEKHRMHNDREVLIQGLKTEALDIVRLLYGGATLQRMTELLNRRRLLHIDRFTDRRGESVWTLPVLQDETEPEDYQTLKALRAAWIERLGRTKGKNVGQLRIADDAEVLGRIEWVNQVMETGGQQKRLVLISGDQALQRTAASYFVRGERSFADLYIRDPRVFLADPDFLITPTVEQSTLGDSEATGPRRRVMIEWLDVLLAPFEPGKDAYFDRLRGISGTEKHDDISWGSNVGREGMVSEPKREWREFVMLAAVGYGFKSPHDMVAEVAERLAKILPRDIPDLIEQEIARAELDFWGAAMQAGFWSTRDFELSRERPLSCPDDTGTPVPPRGVPELRFEHSLKAEDYAKRISATLKTTTLDPREFTLQQLLEEDPSSYNTFLVYGLAFAAAGRWHATGSLSRRAIGIADQLQAAGRTRIVTKITGSEATYLLACALRHDAKSAADLTRWKVGDCLVEAGQRKAREPGHDSFDVRFVAETIALNITYHHFRLFKNEPFPTKGVPSLGECQKELLRLLEPLYRGMAEENPNIGLAVERQTLTNLFIVLLLRQYKQGEATPEKGIDIRTWLQRFKDAVWPEGVATGSSATCLTRAVFLVAGWRYGGEADKAEHARQIHDTYASQKLERCYVMAYDKERYQFLRDIIEGTVC